MSSAPVDFTVHSRPPGVLLTHSGTSPLPLLLCTFILMCQGLCTCRKSGEQGLVTNIIFVVVLLTFFGIGKTRFSTKFVKVKPEYSPLTLLLKIYSANARTIHIVVWFFFIVLCRLTKTYSTDKTTNMLNNTLF